MKKIIVFLVTVFAVLGLTGCFTNEAENKFEITNYPKATYVLGEDFDWDNVSIEINGTRYGKAEAETQGVEFPDIVLYKEGYQKEPGTYAATIKYGSLTATFQYTVLDSYFANGNGTKENPYQISTVYQFYQAFKMHDEVTYYVLINDIDFESNYQTVEEVGNLHIDGQGYALRNVQTLLVEYVHGYDYSIENVDVHINSNGDYFVGSRLFADETGYGTAQYKEVSEKDGRYSHLTVKYKNVNVYGTMLLNAEMNASLFGFVRGNVTMVVENFNNFSDVLNNSGREFALLTSGVLTSANRKSALYFLNCRNYGTITALSATMVCGNPTYCRNTYFENKFNSEGVDQRNTLEGKRKVILGETNVGTTQKYIIEANANNAYFIFDNQTKNYGYIISTLHKTNLFGGNCDNTFNNTYGVDAKAEVMAHIYKYDTKIGIVAPNEVMDKYTEENIFENGIAENMKIAAPQFVDGTKSMSVKQNSNGELVLTDSENTSSDPKTYKITITAYTGYYNINTYKYEGMAGDVLLAYEENLTLEQLNALKVKVLDIANIYDYDNSFFNDENKDITNTLHIYKNSDISETADGIGAIKMVFINGKWYYKNIVTSISTSFTGEKVDVYNFINYSIDDTTKKEENTLLKYTITSFDKNGLPLGSIVFDGTKIA